MGNLYAVLNNKEAEVELSDGGLKFSTTDNEGDVLSE